MAIAEPMAESGLMGPGLISEPMGPMGRWAESMAEAVADVR